MPCGTDLFYSKRTKKPRFGKSHFKLIWFAGGCRRRSGSNLLEYNGLGSLTVDAVPVQPSGFDILNRAASMSGRTASSRFFASLWPMKPCFRQSVGPMPWHGVRRYTANRRGTVRHCIPYHPLSTDRESHRSSRANNMGNVPAGERFDCIDRLHRRQRCDASLFRKCRPDSTCLQTTIIKGLVTR